VEILGVDEKLTGGDTSWRDRLLEEPEAIASVLKQAKRVAVIGIKPEIAGGPAYYVPQYLQMHGYEIIPVPVYFPDITEILGEPVHRALETIEGPIDLVVLFRRSPDVAQHIDEILAARPRAVWMQLGIANAEAAEAFTRAGMLVVQDRCTKVEHQQLLG